MSGSAELATTHSTMDGFTLSAVSVSKADMMGKTRARCNGSDMLGAIACVDIGGSQCSCRIWMLDDWIAMVREFVSTPS